MAWRRLYITVEGQTERKFADEVLQPHLAQYSLDVRSRVVLTNRKLGKRGGILDFAGIRGDLYRLMREDGNAEARFTTMVDLYALPAEDRRAGRRGDRPAEAARPLSPFRHVGTQAGRARRTIGHLRGRTARITETP